MEEMTFVDESPIHGKGLFARVDIPEGTYLGDYEGPIATEDGTYVLWIYDDETGEEYGIDGQNALRYLNHDAQPNAEFDGEKLYTQATIPAGSEIFIHYGEAWDEVDAEEAELEEATTAIEASLEVATEAAEAA
jgi:SET domain-containing protein